MGVIVVVVPAGAVGPAGVAEVAGEVDPAGVVELAPAEMPVSPGRSASQA
jgi:hypothetical protein